MSGGVIHSCRVSEEELDVLPTPPSLHRLTSPASGPLEPRCKAARLATESGIAQGHVVIRVA